MQKENPLHPFWYDLSRDVNENALSQTPRDRKTCDENAGGTQFHTRGANLGEENETNEIESNQLSRKRTRDQDHQETFKRRTFDIASSTLNSESGVLTSEASEDFLSHHNNQFRSNQLSKLSSGPGSYVSSESIYYFHNRVPSSPLPIEITDLNSSPQRNTQTEDNAPFFTSQATVVPQNDDFNNSESSEDTIDFNVDLFNRVNPYYNSDYLQEEFGNDHIRDTYNDHILKEKVRSLIADNIINGYPKLHIEVLGLTKLPDEIEDLKNMTVLGRNGIEIPKIEIYASRNLLRILPPSLFKVSNLSVLSLRQNKLKRVPGIIANLQNLVELIIVTNEIKVLPYQILKLKKLTSCLVRPNPYLIELKDQDPEDYFCISEEKDSDVDVKRYVSKIKWINSNHSFSSSQLPNVLPDEEMVEKVCPLPKLSELVLRHISGYQVTRSETMKWKKNIPTYIQRMIAKAFQKGIFEETCSSCEKLCIDPIAKSLEWWDFKSERLVPIRRNFCCGNCVKVWLRQVEQEKKRYNDIRGEAMDVDDDTSIDGPEVPVLPNGVTANNGGLQFDEDF